MAYRYRNMEIPDHMVEAVLRYRDEGILPEDFLQAVLRNDLKESCGRADDYNFQIIPAYAALCYNELPILCWGDQQRIDAWVKGHADKRVERAKAEQLAQKKGA